MTLIIIWFITVNVCMHAACKLMISLFYHGVMCVGEARACDMVFVVTWCQEAVSLGEQQVLVQLSCLSGAPIALGYREAYPLVSVGHDTRRKLRCMQQEKSTTNHAANYTVNRGNDLCFYQTDGCMQIKLPFLFPCSVNKEISTNRLSKPLPHTDTQPSSPHGHMASSMFRVDRHKH